MSSSKSLIKKYAERRRRKKEEAKKKKPQTFSEAALSWAKTIIGAILVVMIINGIAVASFVVPTGSMENTVLTGDFLFVNKFIYGPSTPQVIPFLNIPLPFYKFPGLRDPERGDVIVFIYPGDINEVKPKEFQYYLKRCVAVAGDTLRIINKHLFVNGKEQPPPPKAKFSPIINNYDRFRTFPPGRGFTSDNYGPLRIPKKGDTVWITARNFAEWRIFILREGHDIKMEGGKAIIDGKPSDFYVVERNYCFGMGDNRDNSEDSRFWGFIPYENVVGTPMIVYWSWDTNLPISDIFEKLASIRWSRIGTVIK